VIAGNRRNERFLALTAEHAARTAARLEVDPSRVSVVGAGYRDDLFVAGDEPALPGRHLVAVGKLSRAKGLPWLLEAFARLATRHDDVQLHLVGSGSGAEAAHIERRAAHLGGRVTLHGRLDDAALTRLLRQADVYVLPSLYEGLPLVVIEALASGCRAVCTDLPGVRGELLPHLDGAVEVVPLPRLVGADVPLEEDLPAFVRDLQRGLERALAAGRPPAPPDLRAFTWRAVFERVQRVWLESLAG